MKTIAVPNSIFLPQVAGLIKDGRLVRLRIRGNSMNPLLVDRRDEVVLSPFAEEDLRVGALVLAQVEGGGYVLHRILKMEEKAGKKQVVMMGDGNYRSVELTEPEKVLGLAVKVIRKGRTIDCDGRFWEVYSKWWMWLLPIRRYVLAVWRRI